MRNGFLGALAALATSAGLAVGQTPPAFPALPGAELTQAGGIGPIEAGAALTDPVPFGGVGPDPAAMGVPQFGGPPVGGLPQVGGPSPQMMGGFGGPPPGMGGFGGPPPGMGMGIGGPEGDGGCTGPGCPGYGGAGGGGNVVSLYGTFEYLLWFPKAMSVDAPLLSTSAPLGRGAIGNLTTHIVAGAEDFGFNTQSGFRLNVGTFLSPNRRVGLDVGAFWLGDATVSRDTASDTFGNPLIARPFVDTLSGLQSALLVAYPNYASGLGSVRVSTGLWSIEGNALLNLFRSEPTEERWLTVNATVGYRYLNLNESVSVQTRSTLLSRGVNPDFSAGDPAVLSQPNVAAFGGLFVFGTPTIGVDDLFETTNQFHGGQVGLSSELRWGRCVMAMSSKLAIGNMHQELEISGFSTLSPGLASPSTGVAVPSVVKGGLLATDGNIGRFQRDDFAVIPELNLSLGYALSPGITLFGGYNFLYLSEVLRPGSQITTNVNPSVVPTSYDYGRLGGIPGHTVPMATEEFWVHGLNFGIQLRF